MPRRRVPNNRGDRDDRDQRRNTDGESEYFAESAEDVRDAREDRKDDREDRRASRDAFYREEAADRRLGRDIKEDTYYEINREELLDQRDDRRLEREFGREELLEEQEDRRRAREVQDRVLLRRGSSIFASDEEVELRRIVERDLRQEKVSQYQQLIQQCKDRIREFHTMEDWLDEIKQSGFEADTREKVRVEARERRLSFLTEQSQVGLLNEHNNWNAEERKVLNDLAYVTEQEDSVYDDILRACDTADPDKLESALANLRACEADAGEVLRRIPRLVTGQQRRDDKLGGIRPILSRVVPRKADRQEPSYDDSDAIRSVLRGCLAGAKWGAIASPIAFLGGCAVGIATDGFFAGFGQGLTWAILTPIIGGALGGAIGFFNFKGRA